MPFPGITLLGLGPGDPSLLTRQAWAALSAADEVYLRTRQHPTVDGLPEGLLLHDFDEIYEQADSFEQVYQTIVDTVLELGRRPQGVLYAVPGHPLIAERTGPEILRRARAEDLPVHLIEGISFVESIAAALGQDWFPNTTLVDALTLGDQHHPTFPVDVPALIAQIHSRHVASEVKLTLMAAYPDEHPVKLIHAAGTLDVLVEDLPLYQIDRSLHTGLLTSLYVPPLRPNVSMEAFQELVAHLRAPEGCPWDREQTHQSLRASLLEETYEVLAALDADDPQAMREEFGDLLLQIVLHAQIAAEYGEFTLADVIGDIYAKIVRRHPHVFGDVQLDAADKVVRAWEQFKAEERAEKGLPPKGILDGLPAGLPALAQAQRIHEKLARVGLSVASPAVESPADTLAAMLFELVTRADDVDAESALRTVNTQLLVRVRSLETRLRAENRTLKDLTEAEKQNW